MAIMEVVDYQFKGKWGNYYLKIVTTHNNGQGITAITKVSTRDYWEEYDTAVVAENKSIEEAEKNHLEWVQKSLQGFKEKELQYLQINHEKLKEVQ